MSLALSQSHQAYLALERLIVTLKLRPGSLVTEGQLIDLSGVGRTPVREAIQKLAWQGLIVVRPRVGLQISAIGADDHRHVSETRAQLEPLTARLVAQHASADERTAMGEIAQQMTACSVKSDLEGFLIADKAFDEAMEAACPNSFLTAALQPLQTHARRLWFSTATVERMEQAIDLHVRVIRAIHKGDGTQAEAAMAALIGALARGKD